MQRRTHLRRVRAVVVGLGITKPLLHFIIGIGLGPGTGGGPSSLYVAGMGNEVGAGNDVASFSMLAGFIDM